ncbi:DUF1642 domain-containing protein [Streptococcus danieliae]|nr:DUF1642 domain-containing protein [Streptococcus danieliae]
MTEKLKYKVGDKVYLEGTIEKVASHKSAVLPYTVDISGLKYSFDESRLKAVSEPKDDKLPPRPQVTQAVVVPTFIDSYIRYAKVEEMSLFIAMDNAQNKASEWIITNEETFARAWLDGYNIEEQKYVVAIPDGRGDGGVVQLWKNLDGIVLLNFGAKTRYGKAYKLTEEEIKRNHAPLWGTEWVQEVADC